MNTIWLWAMALSIAFMLFTSPDEMLSSLTKSAENSLTLCLSLTAVYCLWMGMTQILKDCGTMDFLAGKFQKPIAKLFDTDDREVWKDISTNISANLLGVGNAATPAAISAIRRLDDGNEKASRGMVMLFVVNTAGLQLLPTTLIGIRAAMGSANPGDIILPGLVVSTVMTVISVLLVVIFFPRKNEKVR